MVASRRTANSLPQSFLSKRVPWLRWTMVVWGVAYYLGQPPVHWPLAGWVSAAAFSALVASGERFTRRDFWMSWWIASLVWLGLLHGIRLAFWPLTFGWIALSLYLAVYFPACLAIATGLRRRFGFSIPLASAVAWTTGEVLRAYVITGFAGCMLAHSQTPWPPVLAIASHLGGYGVGFLMTLSMGWIVAFGVSVAERERPGFWSAVSRNALAVLVLFWMTTSVSRLRMRDEYLQGLDPIKPLGTFLLIQENMPTQFEATQESIERGWSDYMRTTQWAVRGLTEEEVVDVLVWPESVFAGGAPYLDWDRGPEVPAELGMDLPTFTRVAERLENLHAAKLQRLQQTVGEPMPSMLLGTDVLAIRRGRMERFNAALWFDSHRGETEYYAKNHLVMFGEYIPVVSWFPELLRRVGLGLLSSGDEPRAWTFRAGHRLSPSICFEDVVPHLLQSHIQRLTEAGQPPDVLVNVSNDGWFRGSSILDHHLNSAILSAVENRMPVLVASNTGLTAWIDGDGRVVERLPRLEAGWIVARPLPDGRSGLWSRWGDWPARCVAILGMMPLALGCWARFRARFPGFPASPSDPHSGGELV